MSILKVEKTPLAQTVRFTEDDLIIDLVDGRKISAPLLCFSKLAKATQEQLEKYEILGDGEGIHWLDIDEDLSVEGLLNGK